MYSVTVRGHMMIAHSLTGSVFGPAQRLHGATYIVDAEFRRRELDPDGVVLDIGLATGALNRVLGELSYRNLDDRDDFKGRNTTTEFLARFVFDRLVSAIRSGEAGPTASAIESIRVTLHESHLAAASYEAPLTLG
jgi:6-pyruvoyltetrahydropterin/6-carboxytetrahydropterin synthase